MKKSKLTLPVVKKLLPQTVRMTYGHLDVLSTALEVGEIHEIGCDDEGPVEFVAVYKLVRVEKA
jgi:hypothetical protein